MTIPAEDVISSASDWLFTVVDELRDLPHVDKVTEITALWTSLKEQKKQELWPVQDDSGLRSLQQNARLNASRLVAKWKKGTLLLVFERLTFVKELRNTFKDIRKSFDQLQVPSKDQIVEQLDNVIVSLCEDGRAYIELESAESEFRKQFFAFLGENRSKPEDAISVITWLAERLDTDVGSVRQELKENEGNFLEELLLYVTELEERNCAPDGEEPERVSDSDEIDFGNKPLDEVARGAVQALGLTQMHWVLTGFDDLIKCTKLPNGRFEVFNAKAIPEAIRLAQSETQYINEAMTLLEALTSSSGAGEEGVRISENRDIYLHISDHLDFLITLMKDQRHPRARLLAAKTVVNMLVNSQVWRTVRTKYDIVSALLAIFNEDKTTENGNRGDRVCLVGLRRLAEFSPKKIKLKRMSPGDKNLIIVTALMELLRDGFDGTVLMNLAKDTLVALDTQVLVTDHRTREVCVMVRSQLVKLMETNEFITHSTMAGRMAIISLMTKLCLWYTDSITEELFLYLLKMIKETGCEIMSRSAAGEDLTMDDVTKLLDLSVKLLCYCVTHGKDKAQAVLTKNVAERETLEVMLEEQNSGILDESKLEILEIFDLIDPAVLGKVAVLVKMAKSQSPSCCERVASRLLKFVEENLNITEMQEAGGITALMDLLNHENVNCQKDALLALYLLSQSMPIQTEELPFQVILGFLHPKWPKKVKDAAVGLLDLVVEESEEIAAKFMDTPEALKAVLHFLDKDAETPCSQQCASAVLKMATEDNASVRLGISNSGLLVLIRFVRKHGSDKHKQLLTATLVLLCQSGNGCEEAVTKAGGHIFLLTSLEENISKEVVAQGLLRLLSNVRTAGDVLQAGFVTITMGSIDRNFACSEMALGLASICSTSDGLDQIVACPRSVGSLLILLERCPTLEGKGAAAVVIAKLYPRLNSDGDARRQEDMTVACSHLIKYLEHEDKSQLKTFLKALAAFATGRKGRQLIHEERGQTPLIRFLKSKETDTQVRDLVLQILAEMSSVFPEGVSRRDSSYHKILNVFLDQKIGELICPLLEEEEFNKNTESMKNVLILIRNLSLAGPPACDHLSESDAVQMLLHVLKNNDSVMSPVTELAVKALVKFTDDPIGKKAFLTGGGIKSLADVLKLDAPRASDVKSFTTIILASVAQDRKTGNVACESIFKCNILQALNTIMYDGETNRIKWQAAVLMKLLATVGPTQRVCAAIYHAGTLDALDYLRSVPHCEEIANDVLKIVRGANRDCRRYIDTEMKKPK